MSMTETAPRPGPVGLSETRIVTEPMLTEANDVSDE